MSDLHSINTRRKNDLAAHKTRLSKGTLRNGGTSFQKPVELNSSGIRQSLPRTNCINHPSRENAFFHPRNHIDERNTIARGNETEVVNDGGKSAMSSGRAARRGSRH
ncbi:hypothetical protein EVAR_49809_1 [Eumeta japonica]|uniref:Uncharacterized protein n=1 Tax=Eumeta variegata TaxID=151549 RepID=A0A4C1XRP4_EUMVA|nr:hypothetical protein EVAR_49809_1 [Eumeta japonica]